jgi:hypothetical protein
VIAVGLIATVAAALLSTDKPLGAVDLSWEAKAPLPDSPPAKIPGGGAVSLGEAGIRVTAANISGYRLYRVAAVLKIDAGSAVGQGRVRCLTRAPHAIIGQTPGSRAAYPRSSSEEDLIKQDAPNTVLVEYSSHSTDLAAVELGDAFDSYTNAHGLVLSWTPYREGAQGWQWGLPKGAPTEPLKLGFASIWRSTTGTPAASISCTVETGAGKAKVHTSGAVASVSSQ